MAYFEEKKMIRKTFEPLYELFFDMANENLFSEAQGK
jgi:hypothetical protein